MRLKNEYILAKCCRPASGEPITGYYSHNNIIKVHARGCKNLSGVDAERLVTLEWADITADHESVPGDDYSALDNLDFRILYHHQTLGVDYSLKVAEILHIDKQVVFDRHARLRRMGLLERVEPRIIRYRKSTARGKWIKHRNHTYYDLTEKGRLYLIHHRRTSHG